MTSESSTTTEQPPPPAPAPPPPRPVLTRSRSDRKLAGVAGGLGRYANVDPLVLRILFVVLAVFGGSGLLLYLLGWVFIPDEGETESEGQRLFTGRSGRTVAEVIGIVVLLVVGLAAVGALLDTGPGIGGLGVLLVVGVAFVLLLRNNQRPTSDHPPGYAPVPVSEPGAYGQTAGTAYAATAPAYGPPPPPPAWQGTAVPPSPPPPPRPKSILGRVTVSVALIVVGLMVGWNTVSAGSQDDFRAVAVLGTALAVVAGGLLVGAIAGRARWLILLGIVLSVATSIAAAADARFAGGVGQRTWTPTTVAAAEQEFRFGVGDARLDLTHLPAGRDVTVEVRLGVGELWVLAPPDATLVVDGEVGAGTLRLLDDPVREGTDLRASTSAEPLDPSGSETMITINAEVGLGELEVRR